MNTDQFGLNGKSPQIESGHDRECQFCDFFSAKVLSGIEPQRGKCFVDFPIIVAVGGCHSCDKWKPDQYEACDG